MYKHETEKKRFHSIDFRSESFLLKTEHTRLSLLSHLVPDPEPRAQSPEPGAKSQKPEPKVWNSTKPPHQPDSLFFPLVASASIARTEQME